MFYAEVFANFRYFYGLLTIKSHFFYNLDVCGNSYLRNIVTISLFMTLLWVVYCTIFSSLVHYARVWTLYEIFLQETDSSIDKSSGREHLRKKCQEMLQKILRKMLETADQKSKDYITIRYLDYRICMLTDETNDNFQFIQDSE